MLQRINCKASIIGAVLIAFMAPFFFVSASGAETDAQQAVAKQRVEREAAKLQHRHKYTYKQGRTTYTVTPRTGWHLWGTVDNDAHVTLRWQITVALKPEQGTADTLVCRGTVTVSGNQTNDTSKLIASLRTGSCIA